MPSPPSAGPGGGTRAPMGEPGPVGRGGGGGTARPRSPAQQPTPVLLPGKSRGQRSLARYSPWSPKQLDTTLRLSVHPSNDTKYQKRTRNLSQNQQYWCDGRGSVRSGQLARGCTSPKRVGQKAPSPVPCPLRWAPARWRPALSPPERRPPEAPTDACTVLT